MVTTQRIVHVPSLPDIVAAFERRRGWQELEFWRNICFVCLHLGNVGANVTALSPSQVLHITYVRKTIHSISTYRILLQVTLATGMNEVNSLAKDSIPTLVR